MSYDIHLRSQKPPCGECGRAFKSPEIDWAPTYNLSRIFDLVITRDESRSDRGLNQLSGRKAGDTIPILDEALIRLNDPERQSALKALEPKNGWGDLPGAVEVIAGLLKLACEYPECVWEIR